MNKRLFVAGLPFSYSEKDLADLFKEFGVTVNVNLISDRDNGRSKGFGFVEFETAEAAQAAIDKLNGFEIQGRKIVVNVARPREERPRRDFRSGSRRFGRRQDSGKGGYGGGRRNRW